MWILFCGKREGLFWWVFRLIWGSVYLFYFISLYLVSGFSWGLLLVRNTCPVDILARWLNHTNWPVSTLGSSAPIPSVFQMTELLTHLQGETAATLWRTPIPATCICDLVLSVITLAFSSCGKGHDSWQIEVGVVWRSVDYSVLRRKGALCVVLVEINCPLLTHKLELIECGEVIEHWSILLSPCALIISP